MCLKGIELSSTQVSELNRDLKKLQLVMNAVGHPGAASSNEDTASEHL
jgi:hypothetical protein